MHIDEWDEWHRKICHAHPTLIVTGELDRSEPAALRQLEEWRTAGVTTIVDVRLEADDIDFVAQHAPEIRYIWAGVHDHGGEQPDEWFDQVIAALGDTIHDPNETILVHCQMGVNRGPSMAFRIMLAQGWKVRTALRAIRDARPIAAVLYADSAVRHHHTINGSDPTHDLQIVTAWFYDLDTDTTPTFAQPD